MRRLVGPLIIACLVLAGCQRSDRTDQGGTDQGGGASIDGFQFDGVFYARWTAVTSWPASTIARDAPGAPFNSLASVSIISTCP